MIAVHPDLQGQGRGKVLLRYVETALRASGQRLLLIETSGLPRYDRTRAFYAKCGFEEEARIRDFWAAGDDKVVFRKALNKDYSNSREGQEKLFFASGLRTASQSSLFVF
jgi:ribosomal protein S18 acetylase RimI-like enzyme